MKSLLNLIQMEMCRKLVEIVRGFGRNLGQDYMMVGSIEKILNQIKLPMYMMIRVQ